MNVSGGMLGEYSFDPWGRRRNPLDWSYNIDSIDLLFDRGFTGHEHLDEFGLINMNGRVYDPLLAMFLSPDSYMQAPDFTQNYNRYSYVLNNPLIYNDPSGNMRVPYQRSLDMIPWGGFGDIASGGAFRNGTAYALAQAGLHEAGPGSFGGGGGYYYEWDTGQYKNDQGVTVDYNEVHYNFVVPNSDFSFSGVIAQDIYRTMTQVSSSTNYTASVDGTTGSFSEYIASMLPVAFVMEGVLSFEAGVAASMTPGGIGLVLRGKNSGTVFFYSAGGVGGGWFGAAGSLNSAYFFYTGDVNKFSQYSLEGKSTVISVSAGEVGSFGRSIILMKDNYGGVIIGIGTSFGAGGSPTIVSGQITIQQTHIWP
jgi:RHS repeat-associated protein